jgi:hypothetical protein
MSQLVALFCDIDEFCKVFARHEVEKFHGDIAFSCPI